MWWMGERGVIARRWIRRISARALKHCWRKSDLERERGYANDSLQFAVGASLGRGLLISPVAAISAQDPIVSIVSPQRITAVGADQNIVADAAVDLVTASAGVDAVISFAAVDCVIAVAAGDYIAATLAENRVISGAAADGIGEVG